jgi:hypothetical protein
MGLILSLVAFAASWLFGRRSLGAGLAVVLTAGFAFGIVRANYLDGFSPFLFDAAVFGLYLARFSPPNGLKARHARGLTVWVGALIGWPIVLFCLAALFPQHLLIQLVGLRAAVWFLPFLLLGASARLDDLTLVTRTLAVLNLVELPLAASEYYQGLEAFLPRNPVTELVYRSNDVAGHAYHRIPGTFPAAGIYGTVMVATIPWLVGRWSMPGVALGERWLLGAAVVAAALGTFMSGSRTPVVFLFALSFFVAYLFRVRARYLIPAIGVAVLVGYAVAGSDRLQRFASLQDTDVIVDRLQGSVNLTLLDLFVEYPLGVGLGRAFGTSIPSFLAHLAERPIGAENEYARIAVEQGLMGMTMWVAFLVWFFLRRRAGVSPAWRLGAKLMFVNTLLVWGTGLIGCGLLSSIPGTTLLLFQMGMLARDRPIFVPARKAAGRDAGRRHRGQDILPAPSREEEAWLPRG